MSDTIKSLLPAGWTGGAMDYMRYLGCLGLLAECHVRVIDRDPDLAESIRTAIEEGAEICNVSIRRVMNAVYIEPKGG